MPRLLETFADWIAEAGWCGYDHTGELPGRIYHSPRGKWPAEDVVQLWDDCAGIAGIAINLRFGVAFDVFTAPRLRGGDAERQMLRSALETTASMMRGTDEPYVLTDVWDCDAERIRLITALGFRQFRIWDEVRVADLRARIPEPDANGFVLRSARLTDADGLAAARNHSFGSDWTGERYRSAVMTKPGYDPGREIVAVAPDGRIASYTIGWIDSRNKIGHFEPVGTHSDFRGRGLARAVMLYAMNQMQRDGVTIATVHHLAENIPALRLYESIGFEKRHETLGFRRPLSFGR
jgi:mycothiol synthase